jgi:hypothetical protein
LFYDTSYVINTILVKNIHHLMKYSKWIMMYALRKSYVQFILKNKILLRLCQIHRFITFIPFTNNIKLVVICISLYFVTEGKGKGEVISFLEKLLIISSSFHLEVPINWHISCSYLESQVFISDTQRAFYSLSELL